MLLRCYFEFVLPILEYCSRCVGQLLERQVFAVARFSHDQTFLSLYHRRRVAGLSMLYKVDANFNHSLFSELPSASTRVRHTRAAAAPLPLEFGVSRLEPPNLQGVSCRQRFECRMPSQHSV